MKLYMFRTVPLSVIRSLFTVNSAVVYVIQVCRQLSSRCICSCSKAVYKPVWHMPLPSVHWINSWWWTDELSETSRVSCQNKIVKLVHLFGFITKKNTCNQFSIVYSTSALLWLYCMANFTLEQFMKALRGVQVYLRSSCKLGARLGVGVQR
jgi:hypothetical protein